MSILIKGMEMPTSMAHAKPAIVVFFMFITFNVLCDVL